MIFFKISVIAGLLANGVLGTLVFAINPRRPANRHFLILTLVISAWLVCLALGSCVESSDALEQCMRLASIMAIMAVPAIDTLRLAITGQTGYRQRIKARLALWLFLTIPVAVLCNTDFFIQGVLIAPAAFPQPVYGPGNVLYMAYFLVAIGLLIIELRKDLLALTGTHRAELNFALLGCATGLFVAILLAQILPALIQNWTVAQFAPLSVICLDGFVAYGIATRRIMDVTDVLRRMIAYGLLIAGLTALYLAVWHTADWLLAFLIGGGTLWPHLLAALTLALSMAPAAGWMQRWAARLFLSAQAINIQDAIRKTTSLMQSVTTLDQLLEKFCQTVAHAVSAETAALFLPDAGGFRRRYPPGDAPLVLASTDPLVQHLQGARNPLELDLARRVHSNRRLWEACHSLAQLRMTLAIGIRGQNRLNGILLLGARQNGRLYGAREQDALQLLGNQLTVAIDNARLFTEIQQAKFYNDILLDNLVSGVIAVDERLAITVFNREARRVTGLSVEATLNQPADTLPEPLRTVILQTVSSGRGLRDRALRLNLGAGREPVPLRVGSAILPGPDQRVWGALLVFQDQSTIRKLELQVQRSDQLASLGTLAAGMAHEIKNPLVAIKTFAQLLPARYQDTDFRDTFGALLEQEVNRIDEIVNELLTLARPAKPMLGSLSVNDVLTHALELVKQPLYQKSIVLTCSLEAAPDRIQGDAKLLGQLFVNLLFNAADAMESAAGERRLTVSTGTLPRMAQTDATSGQEGDPVPHILISIGDTGEGIRHEDIPHIFDPFFTTKVAGTGMGLSVAHRIAQEHGGAIDVESTRGRGSLFQVVFPLERRTEPATAPDGHPKDRT